MKITKEKLKQIIKEELGGILSEMGPEFPGEELPQGGDLDQALNPPMATDAVLPPEVEEMNQWYAENPQATADEIARMWSDISHSHHSRGTLK